MWYYKKVASEENVKIKIKTNHIRSSEMTFTIDVRTTLEMNK